MLGHARTQIFALAVEVCSGAAHNVKKVIRCAENIQMAVGGLGVSHILAAI